MPNHLVLTQGSSEERKVSHCYRSRSCHGEPTCTTRVVQFEALAVAMQPRFHHVQHLNEVMVRRVAQLDISAKWLEPVEVVLLLQQTCAFLRL